MDIDPALWVATSMPLKGTCADSDFLIYMDEDSNGRITHAEVQRAVLWLFGVLDSDRPVDERSDSLDLSTLRRGERTAEQVRISLSRLGVTDAVSLDELKRLKTKALNNPVSDIGVVLPSASEDETIASTIALAIAVSGGAPHPAGAHGLDSSSLDTFLHLLALYRGISDLPEDELLRYRRFHKIIGKIDEFFSLCAIASLSGHTPATAPASDLESLPIAKPNIEGVLHTDEPGNPAYADDLSIFWIDVGRSPGDAGIRDADWRRIRALFEKAEAAEAVLASIGAGAVGAFSRFERLDESTSEETIGGIRDLIASSIATTVTLEEINRIEKLLLFQIHMLNLANNFVSFPGLYDRSERAWFEYGTLIIDSRTFRFAVFVDDRAKHLTMARNANMYVIYLQIRRSGEAVLYEVGVPVTSSGRGNLSIGKRGIFIDRNGIELDAEVVEIIDNPISIAEAIVSPIRRLLKTITGKIESLTTKADEKLQQFAGSTVDALGNATTAPVANPPPVTDRSGIGSALLGGSVAIAALGSATAYITTTLASMRWWQVLAGFGAALLAVVVPAVVLAMLKLKRRDMSSIIEASGWAVNVRMKLTRRLQRVFTADPIYPKGAKGSPAIRRRRFLVVASVVIVCIVIVVVSFASGLFAS